MSSDNVEFVEGLVAGVANLDKQAMLAALPSLIVQGADPEVESVEDPQRADGRMGGAVGRVWVPGQAVHRLWRGGARHHMQPRYVGALAASLALALLGSASASHAAKLGPVSVEVPRQPSLTGDLRISFLPRYLPRGGYYYAVVVLENYREHVVGAPPACSVSSDMDKTEYGYPHRGRRLRLLWETHVWRNPNLRGRPLSRAGSLLLPRRPPTAVGPEYPHRRRLPGELL
jgi:hypothetical protein